MLFIQLFQPSDLKQHPNNEFDWKVIPALFHSIHSSCGRKFKYSCDSIPREPHVMWEDTVFNSRPSVAVAKGLFSPVEWLATPQEHLPAEHSTAGNEPYGHAQGVPPVCASYPFLLGEEKNRRRWSSIQFAIKPKLHLNSIAPDRKINQ